MGSAVSSPERSGAEPQPKSNLVHFCLTSGSNNFSDFPAHLHIIFHRMVVENVCLYVHDYSDFVTNE